MMTTVIGTLINLWRIIMRMNKFFLIVSLLLALSILLAACVPAAPAVPTQVPVKKVKVLLLTEDPIGVNPYFITASDGLKKAALDLDVETKVIESNGDATNMDENLRAAAREDFNLIILMTFGFNDTLRQVAPTTPDIFYVCVDCGVDLTGPYMVSRVFVGIQVMLFKDQRLFLKKPTDRLSAYLSTLGTNSQVFLDPRYQFTPIIPKIVL
jgi:hypothetical protein